MVLSQVFFDSFINNIRKSNLPKIYKRNFSFDVWLVVFTAMKTGETKKKITKSTQLPIFSGLQGKCNVVEFYTCCT